VSASILLRESVPLAPTAWAGILAEGTAIDAAGCARFPTVLIAAAQASGARPVIVGLSEPVLGALRVVGAGALLGLEPITASRLPFAAQIRADGRVSIVVAATAATVPVTSTPVAHDWAAHLAMPAVDVDLSQLVTMNSVVIAWLLQLGHSAHPAAVRLNGANRQVVAQLRQLRLDQVLTLA
jgi:hypothetical protein